MAIKHGYIFEAEIKRSIEDLAKQKKIDGNLLFLWKMVDTHSFSKMKALTNGACENLIIPKVPADFLMFYNGHPMMIECKMTSRKPSYDLGWIKEHQINAGLKLMAQGIPYYFVINKRWNDPSIKPGKPQPYELYIVDAQTISMLKEELAIEGKHSIKWHLLKEASLVHLTTAEHRDTKKSIWDLEWLLTEGLTLDTNTGMGKTLKSLQLASGTSLDDYLED